MQKAVEIGDGEEVVAEDRCSLRQCATAGDTVVALANELVEVDGFVQGEGAQANVVDDDEEDVGREETPESSSRFPSTRITLGRVGAAALDAVRSLEESTLVDIVGKDLFATLSETRD